ncbi:unnamed protein product [Chilo suppressalis]|uniref:CCHC-type domain-containing protein n=1 Tax=Chilo suppressalis TaxID=168631 RepID=A0ABN8B507_CHISP|nr:unnamed protein product [Chilo suppressalis]
MWCGRDEIHGKIRCPAAKETCRKCKRRGHFARCCKDKRINHMEGENEEFLLDVGVVSENYNVNYVIKM